MVCENNGYAIHEPIAKRRARPDSLVEIVGAMGVPATRIDGADTLAIRDAAVAAIGRMRAGGGPEFLEVMVYRWREHVGPNEDYDQGYRPRTEAEPWMERDALAGLAQRIDPEPRARIESVIEAEIKDAVAFAETSPPPGTEELLSDVFA
jgi:pyruvate dehydrogenase E1 component alpha subunit